jgi:hypothetical protein
MIAAIMRIRSPLRDMEAASVDRHLTVTVKPAGRCLLAGAPGVYGVRDLQFTPCLGRVGPVVGAGESGKPRNLGTWSLSRTGRARRFKIGGIPLCGASYRGNCGRRSGPVGEVIPAEANARAEEDGDEGAQGARSQL